PSAFRRLVPKDQDSPGWPFIHNGFFHSFLSQAESRSSQAISSLVSSTTSHRTTSSGRTPRKVLRTGLPTILSLQALDGLSAPESRIQVVPETAEAGVPMNRDLRDC